MSHRARTPLSATETWRCQPREGKTEEKTDHSVQSGYSPSKKHSLRKSQCKITKRPYRGFQNSQNTNIEKYSAYN